MSENTLNIYEKKAEEMTATHIIPVEAKFSATEGGFISLDLNGKHYDRVKVVRLFPFTDANKYLSIREYGGASKEIGIIEDLDAMPEETKSLIEHQLTLCYFTPVISKIYSIKDEYGYAYFHVLTDKGECKFAINMGSNAVSKLSDTRLIIQDVDENRFEIRDTDALTQKEKRMLDLFM
ncbi:MAG: DUF1854 domain-containing protein [Lachnospiraceae bacterium]|nr:DUF1854 domain-containing protein [Lachnospiraceae bacterium]